MQEIKNLFDVFVDMAFALKLYIVKFNFIYLDKIGTKIRYKLMIVALCKTQQEN